jgi:superfamily II DNA or RNA helicase/HKD family nuclease
LILASPPNDERLKLVPGLYEHLLNRSTKHGLEALNDPRLYSIAPIDPEEAHSAIAQYLEHLIAGSLAAFRGAEAAEQQMKLVDKVLSALTEELTSSAADELRMGTPLQRLHAVYSTPTSTSRTRPDTQLSRSALLTGTRQDPSLGSQLCKEIQTADRVDVLCSFIRWSGLRIILEQLGTLTAVIGADSPRLRVITTSYMGATDPRAVEELRQLPNTEVRISYDTRRTRLHAKAYIIHRHSGFGCAYVGSANLSNAALSEGLEWTTKISQYELPYLWAKLNATFESYWRDDDFELFTAQSGPRLREAIGREQAGTGRADSTFVAFDIRPHPYQEEILDILSAERAIQGKNRHLIVAATGTGKTVVAAFDYRRYCQKSSERPSLLFIAHREEILQQSLGTFRAVLRDQNFGDMLVGGREPDQAEHLFCSVQSYNSRELWNLPTNKYRYVVVDEFHHAAAPTYRRLMDRIRPEILLGLTATPERSDQLDVFHWFGGAASAEIRLPDAISRRLLSPFQYFGIADSVDLDQISWQRGGYSVSDLDRVYTGNDVRAGLIVDKVRQILLDPLRARALAFCVSVAHAEFMARFFNDKGLPAQALSANSSDEERRTAIQRLRQYDVNFLFVVDLYNEGVDIPEVDTVLFLRPTESLTVFLQQLGRGLRLFEEKECLTVLDFVGVQRREFRFAPRLRSLITNPTIKLDAEIENGFPHLPPGCVINLERVAQQRILANVRETLRIQRPRMVAAIRELGRQIGRAPTIQEGLDVLDLPLAEVLRRGLWSRLLSDAGLLGAPTDDNEGRLARGLLRICHIEDPVQIRFLLAYLENGFEPTTLSEDERRRLEMLHVALWGEDGVGWTLSTADTRLRANQSALADLRRILEYRLMHLHSQPQPASIPGAGPLAIHASYSRDEALVGLGHWSLVSRPSFREGVLHLPAPKVDAFFVTLQKTEHEYSPTTMYEDYAISRELFHWQSQSLTSAESPTGQRYIFHRSRGYTPMLFVREIKTLTTDIAAPYAFLGPCEYVSHEGSRPMSIVWKLEHPIPARMQRWTKRQQVG